MLFKFLLCITGYKTHSKYFQYNKYSEDIFIYIFKYIYVESKILFFSFLMDIEIFHRLYSFSEIFLTEIKYCLIFQHDLEERRGHLDLVMKILTIME